MFHKEPLEWSSAATYSPPWGKGDWKVASILAGLNLDRNGQGVAIQQWVVFRGDRIPTGAPTFQTKDWAMLCANHFNRLDRAAFPMLSLMGANEIGLVGTGCSSGFEVAHVLRLSNLEITWDSGLTLPWYTEALLKLLAPKQVVNKKPLPQRFKANLVELKYRLLWGTRGKPQERN